MRTSVFVAVLVSSFFAAACSESSAPAQPAGASAAVAKAAAVCEHGVQSDICARCNPKLEPAFRAQNDWCQEHARPESQCVLCNPELAKKGIK